MEKKILNSDGSESIVEVVTNPDGTQTETVLSTSPAHQGNQVVSTTPVTPAEVLAKVPPFVVTDKTQKFYQFKNANGKLVHAMHVSPTQVVEYYPNRTVKNLVVTDKSPLISLVDITSVTNKSGKSIATVNFDSSVLSKSIVYYSTAPFSVTLGTPNNVLVPNDALKAENGNLALNHTVEIQGLNAGTTYHYAIVTADETGTQNVTSSDFFKTEPITFQ